MIRSNWTIIFCTNNLTPKPLLQATLEQAAKGAEEIGAQLVIVSHLPISEDPAIYTPSFRVLTQTCRKIDKLFELVVEGALLDKSKYDIDIIDVVCGLRPSTQTNFCKQLVMALEYTVTDNVLIAEDDVLWPEGYCQSMTDALTRDLAVYSPYIFLDACGFYNLDGIFALSRYAGRTSLLHDHFYVRSKKHSKYVSFEPQLKGLFEVPCERAVSEEVYESFTTVDGPPVLDIKHGLNYAGIMMGSSYEETHEYWGHRKQYEQYLADEKTTAFLREHQEYIVGLHMVARQGKKQSPRDIALMTCRAFGVEL